MALSREEIERRVGAFERWHYAIDLAGVRTPIGDERLVNRHEQRRRHVLGALLDRCGGSLAGRRVLDLGCNAGFWSLSAIEAGCAAVLGIDARPLHVDQARLVFEAREVDPGRYAFRVGDALAIELDDEAPFDVVLCLGLLYHVADPLGLFDRLARWTGELLVVDTSLASGDGAAFELRREPPDDPRNTVGSGLVLRPTLAAVLTMADRHGMDPEVLEPDFTSWEGALDYREGRRRAVLCAPRRRAQGAQKR